ncbi:WcbI family polysaccharide biosynthesis putative acetyltransferase [Terrarubrum flagellatum]|uniref:WcbI family polysaccharide biosynthesis putative acetyltransferase n=1 Tax=Terrirubrum flagellatum TaxID=2895980 RepID=UPI003144F6EA
MKICILGNCQAQHLEMMLGVANQDVQIDRLPPVFMMQDSDKDGVYEKLNGADAIFAQRISREYNLDWVSSAEVRREFGDKVTVWPNIYFDGYFPGVQYVYLAKWGKLLSPLGEYHFEQVRSAHAAGKSVEEAIDAFAGDGLFETSPDPFGGSLDQLRARESDVDAPISDAIAESLAESRQFYTPNHPVNGLLTVMLERLATKADIRIDSQRAAAAPYRLDECYIATSPAIVSRFELPFDHTTIYRGRDIVSVEPHAVTLGGARDYDSKSLVEAFYRLYDAVRTCS